MQAGDGLRLSDPAKALPAMSPAATPTPRIPDYELIRLIGGGSYGDVWLARGITGAFRAVKIVWRDRFPDLRPFAREFEGITRFAAVSLREPSQLALLHAGRDDAAGMFYYVMELADDTVQGRAVDPARYRPLTLREVFAQRGRLPAAEVVGLGVALARALASLHAAGLVHRDVKPSNVIFVGGVPKLADVGLVTAASTEQITFVGTEGFVPPEGPGAPAADVYSLGKLLYELSTGLDRNDFPRLPAELGEWTDRREFLELNEVLLRACEGDARRRFTDAGALLDELLLLQAGKSVRRLRRAERRLSRALRVAAALAVIAAFAGTGAWVERRRANVETMRRAAAEAERDALARRAVYAATLARAQRALEQDYYGQARRFLATSRPQNAGPDLRGFEWRALDHDALGDEARLLRSGGAAGLTARGSPRGRWWGVSTREPSLLLWDASTGEERKKIPGVQLFSGFSADEEWALGIDDRSRLSRWRVSDGRIESAASVGTHWPIGWTDGARAVALVQRPQQRPHVLRCWDFAAGKVAWEGAVPLTDDGTGGDFYGATLTADGRHCALALLSGRASDARWHVLVLSLPDLRVRWKRALEDRPLALALSTEGAHLFLALGNSRTVSAFAVDAPDGSAPEWEFRMPFAQPEALALDGAGRLAVGGRRSSVCLIDAGTGKIVATRRGHESDVRSAAFHPINRTLLTTGSGGDVRWWSDQPGRPGRTLAGFAAPAGGGRALCLSPDGRWLAATAPGARARLVALDGSGGDREVEGVVAPLAFSADGKSCWLATRRGTLELEPVVAGNDAGRWSVTLPFVPIAAAISADGKRFAAVDKEARLALGALDSPAAARTFSARHGYPWWVAISPQGDLVATGGRDGVTRLWSAESGELVREWRPANAAVNGAFSPDGKLLALVEESGVAEWQDARGQAPARTLLTSSGVLQGVAFHPREPRLLLGGRDGALHVVDLERAQELVELRASSGQETAATLARIAISRDGQHLAGYLEDGSIRLWHAPRGD